MVIKIIFRWQKMNKLITAVVCLLSLSSCFFNFESEKGGLIYKNNCSYPIDVYISKNAKYTISISPGKNYIELFIIGDEINPKEPFYIGNGEKGQFYVKNSKNNLHPNFLLSKLIWQ